jgi:hypothetical protein
MTSFSDYSMDYPWGDFESWESDTRKAFQNHDQKIDPFCHALINALDMLVKTGSLPAELDCYESNFSSHVKSVIVPGILSAKIPTDADHITVVRVLDFFLEFGCYGIAIADLFPIEILLQILQTDNQPCFQSVESLYAHVINKLRELRLLEQLSESIQCNAQTLEVLVPLLSILTTYLVKTCETNPAKYLDLSLGSLHKIITRFSNTVSFNLVITSLDILRAYLQMLDIRQVHWVGPTLDILLQYLHPEQFERCMSVLERIQKLIEDPSIAPEATQFLCTSVTLKTLLNIGSHLESAQCIRDILTRIPVYARIPEDFICQVLDQYHSIDPSARSRFKQLLVEIGRAMCADDFNMIVDSFFDTPEFKDHWFALLDVLINIIEERESDPAMFDRIRDILILNKSEEARNTLLKMVKRKRAIITIAELDAMAAGDDNFMLIWYPLFLTVITDNMLSLDSEDETAEALKKGCLKRGKTLRLADLMLIQNRNPDFFAFLNKLIDNHQVSLDIVRDFADMVTTMTRDVYLVIKKLIFMECPLPITTLPFPEENLLWQWAITPNAFSTKFASVLSKLYSSNFKVMLSDQAMISTFLEKWRLCDLRQPEVLQLLRIFIDMVEQTDDRFHRNTLFPVAIDRLIRDADIRLICHKQHYRIMVPRSIRLGGLIMMIVHEVKGIEDDPSRFVLYAKGVPRKITTPLTRFLDNGIGPFMIKLRSFFFCSRARLFSFTRTLQQP